MRRTLLPFEDTWQSSWFGTDPSIKTFLQIFRLKMPQTNPHSFQYRKILAYISSNDMDPLLSGTWIVWKTKKGYLFPHIFVSLILLHTQWNATMCWHLSANLQVENILVGQSCPQQRLREPFTQLFFKR